MQYFSLKRNIRFGECDPAGVVYYPVFFNWFHELMEAWFAQELGMTYAECIKTCGFPAKETKAEFFRPCALGEEVVLRLHLSSLSNRSMRIEIFVLGTDGQKKAQGHVVCVCIGVSKDGFQFSSMKIPEKLAYNMKKFLHDRQ